MKLTEAIDDGHGNGKNGRFFGQKKSLEFILDRFFVAAAVVSFHFDPNGTPTQKTYMKNHY